ncbi:hypothetical protein [Stenotrophomonas indicatrix]|uniref:hypothetical protein n=1 Tax=Stenotrophomonas indicatrix TaxID=2045451 RepID=UPI00289C2CC8|nr:hypothetical protein [Stenotrophomonas indicatrix]
MLGFLGSHPVPGTDNVESIQADYQSGVASQDDLCVIVYGNMLPGIEWQQHGNVTEPGRMEGAVAEARRPAESPRQDAHLCVVRPPAERTQRGKCSVFIFGERARGGIAAQQVQGSACIRRPLQVAGQQHRKQEEGRSGRHQQHPGRRE